MFKVPPGKLGLGPRVLVWHDLRPPRFCGHVTHLSILLIVISFATAPRRHDPRTRSSPPGPLCGANVRPTESVCRSPLHRGSSSRTCAGIGTRRRTSAAGSAARHRPTDSPLQLDHGTPYRQTRGIRTSAGRLQRPEGVHKGPDRVLHLQVCPSRDPVPSETLCIPAY